MSSALRAVKWGGIILALGTLGYFAVQSYQAINNSGGKGYRTFDTVIQQSGPVGSSEHSGHDNLRPLLEEAISSSARYFTDEKQNELYRLLKDPSSTVDDVLDRYLTLWLIKSITPTEDKQTLGNLIPKLDAMYPYAKNKPKLDHIIRKITVAIESQTNNEGKNPP